MSRSGQTPKGKATRARIVEVATKRFVENGYVATTMAAIAGDAEVSPQAVYLAFGSKAAILKAAHDFAVVGDYEELSLSERPWMDALRDCPDASSALDLALEVVTELTERTNPVFRVLQSASADPEVAKLLDTMTQERQANWRELAELLAAKPGFNRDVSARRAADILFTLAGPDVLRGIITDSGWSSKEWRDFVRTVTRTHLLITQESG